jgi:hypothetical protein
VRRVRSEIAEEGRGLFVVALGGTGIRALVEAYYPEDIRSEYAARALDRFRRCDFEQGRLVVVSELFKWVGELHPARILEVRRNARNARSHLKRAYDTQSHLLALNEANEREMEAPLSDFADWYADSVMNTIDAHKVKNTPKGRR